MINIISRNASINDVRALLRSLSKHMPVKDGKCTYMRYDPKTGKYKAMLKSDWKDEIKSYRERAHEQVLFAIFLLGDLTIEGEVETYILDNLKRECYKYLNFLVDLSISPDKDKRIL
jgi:hypothetical protein